MKTKLRNRLGLLVTVFGLALQPGWAQEPTPLPFVTGHVTFVQPASDQTISLNVEARIVQQGALLLPMGTVLVTQPGEEPTVFEVKSLQITRVEASGTIVATEANLIAENREKDKTLRLILFDEDTEAVKALPPDYHQPFQAGDCVTTFQIGDTEYNPAFLQALQQDVAIKAPVAQLGS